LAERQPAVYRQALQRFDRLLVARAMRLANGLQSQAAELLGLSRPTLRVKLRTILEDRPSETPTVQSKRQLDSNSE
jgi:DNA-binding NtrC family response regulator